MNKHTEPIVALSQTFAKSFTEEYTESILMMLSMDLSMDANRYQTPEELHKEAKSLDDMEDEINAVVNTPEFQEELSSQLLLLAKTLYLHKLNTAL